ncbi:11227_t:CDS:2, partial [Paraglomus occultum]
MNTDEVLRLKKSLEKATQEARLSSTLELLQRLKENVKPTKELLRKTEIGLLVSKQKSHKNADIARLAKEIIAKWKKEIGNEGRSSAVESNGYSDRVVNSKISPKSLSRSSTPKASIDSNSRPAVPSNDSDIIRGENAQYSISSPTTPIPDTPSSDREGDRNIITDNISGPFVGDSRRDRCIELLYNAMAFDSSNDSKTILERAIKIEKTVLDQFGGKQEKEYRDKLRSLILNLKDKKNPELRASVVSGELPVTKFCTMSKEDMASEEKKARDRAIRQIKLFESRGAGPSLAETDAFRCGKCGNRKCTYYQMQTRSADEPMTTFVTCTICNNRWK